MLTQLFYSKKLTSFFYMCGYFDANSTTLNQNSEIMLVLLFCSVTLYKLDIQALCHMGSSKLELNVRGCDIKGIIMQ